MPGLIFGTTEGTIPGTGLMPGLIFGTTEGTTIPGTGLMPGTRIAGTIPGTVRIGLPLRAGLVLLAAGLVFLVAITYSFWEDALRLYWWRV
jgi:hypothetical protein